jgi:hypothetical protein
MRFRMTLHLLLVAGVLGLAIWFIVRRPPAPLSRLDTPVLPITAEAVTRVSVKQEGFFMDCLREGDEWAIQRPIRCRADEGGIAKLLDALEMMTRQEIVTAAQRDTRSLSLDDYGLREPRARFIVWDTLGRYEVAVGRDAPLSEFVYVMVEGEEDVLATHRRILETIPKTVESIRDRLIMRWDAARTSRLEIACPETGFIQLARRDGRWLLQQPVVARADEGRVARILETLFALRVERFMWDSPVGDEPEPVADVPPSLKVEPYGLAPDEAVRVSVWTEGEDVGDELLIGKPAGEEGREIYAKKGDSDSIFTVKAGVLGIFGVEPNDLRDRRVFDITPDSAGYLQIEEGDARISLQRGEARGWEILDPVQWRADHDVVRHVIQAVCRLQVEAFLPGSAEKLEAYGLRQPALKIALLTAPPTRAGAASADDDAERNQPASVATSGLSRLLIAAPKEGETSVHAYLEGDKAIFKLALEQLGVIPANPTDPLLYRDRTVLALTPESIHRIAVSRGDNVESVTRAAGGTWRALLPSSNTVDKATLEELLFTAANVRALRIEGHNPASYEPYGLDKPALSLTFGLSGEEGIQKTLLFGFKAKTDGIFSMVQGQDVVFVVPNGIIDRLGRRLTLPPGPGANILPPKEAPPRGKAP